MSNLNSKKWFFGRVFVDEGKNEVLFANGCVYITEVEIIYMTSNAEVKSTQNNIEIVLLT